MADDIILNRIQCSACNDIITSHHQHDYKQCYCHTVSVDGGRTYLKRSYKCLNSDGSLPYTELSVTSSAPFEEVRKALCRGSRGKDGTQSLTWIHLAEISDDYLDNLITYQEQNMYTESIDYKYQLMEKQYRKDNNISIGEQYAEL